MFSIWVEYVTLFHFELTDSFKMGKKLTVSRDSYHPLEFFLSKIVVFRKVSGLFFYFLCFQVGQAEMFIFVYERNRKTN